MPREFGITQAAVSQHLKVLRESGFATVRAEGTRRLYTLDPAPLREVDAWLEHFRGFWTHKLMALATEIARGKKARAAERLPVGQFARAAFSTQPERFFHLLPHLPALAVTGLDQNEHAQDDAPTSPHCSRRARRCPARRRRPGAAGIAAWQPAPADRRTRKRS